MVVGQDTGGSTPESPSGAGSPLGSHHPSSGVVPEVNFHGHILNRKISF